MPDDPVKIVKYNSSSVYERAIPPSMPHAMGQVRYEY